MLSYNSYTTLGKCLSIGARLPRHLYLDISLT